MHERFLEIWYQHIHREGSDALLNWLCKSDFFSAPASTRFHGSFEGGLVAHSVNVFDRLVQLVNATLEESERPSIESIAVVALCHDLCKVNFYTTEFRNRKNEKTGQWEKVPFYTIDDQLCMGHGEGSLYIASGFMKLSRDEAWAIRYHMGAWAPEVKGGDATVSKAFEKCSLAVLLHTADMLATYLDEG